MTTGKKSVNYADLQNKLNRLRIVLAHETMMSHLITTEPELFPDPIDQAPSEHESDIALSVKLLTIEKLRRIEQAFTSLHTRSYGICSRCSHRSPMPGSEYSPIRSTASPVSPSSSKNLPEVDSMPDFFTSMPAHRSPGASPLARLAPCACPFLPGEGASPGLRLF